MSDCEKKVEEMEKDIVYLIGRERLIARRKYFQLLKSYSKECGLEDPIYLKRK
jgi:hypothetical protein